jgi:DNA-binding CsgD family transcriptional regulator
VDAAAVQPDRGAGDQVPDGAGDQDLARAGQRGDPGPGMHRDAPDLAAGPVFHLAGVHAGADLQVLGAAAYLSGDTDGAIQLASQQQRLAGLPGWLARGHSHLLIGALIEAGDLASAASACAAALVGSRDSGEPLSVPALLMLTADLDLRAGRIRDAAAHLREGLQAAIRAGDWFDVAGNGLWHCAMLCTATGRPADAVTMWAASDAQPQAGGGIGSPGDARRREEAQGTARQALGPGRARAAEQRGAAMSLDTAAEYALMLTDPAPPAPAAAASPGLGRLSARERELITLIAQGRTNAQIAAQLHISVRTVSSHLDQIRDKTGCRRRADLTRLALTAGLI